MEILAVQIFYYGKQYYIACKLKCYFSFLNTCLFKEQCYIYIYIWAGVLQVEYLAKIITVLLLCIHLKDIAKEKH